jgi:serine/threonine protein kinase
MLGRSVALKILPERFADSPEAKSRLLQEARSASQLHHPGIATVYEAGEHEGRLYMAFEHVDGETVAQRVEREGPLPIDEAVRIARETAAALGYAHANGILHRDVTAGNVMLDRTGAVKLVDFGLALPETQTRVTRPASAPGTLG